MAERQNCDLSPLKRSRTRQNAQRDSDPSNSELCVLLAVLNFDQVADLHLGSATAELHTAVADVESMREMAVIAPRDPQSHWHDRLSPISVPFRCR